MPKRKSFWKRHAEGKETRYHQRLAMRDLMRKAPNYQIYAKLRSQMIYTMLEPSRMRRAWNWLLKKG